MNLAPYLLAIAAALILAAWLHEGSHYLIGWIGKTGPMIDFRFGVPNEVRHENIETMDSALIRMSGISILAWIPSGLLAFGLLVANPSPLYLFFATTNLVVVGMSTESDAIAARNPEKFRRMALNQEFTRSSLFLPDYTEWFSRS